ncbi:hypothetical protein ACH48_11545 [Aeromonas caviae]|nr:hypothetical protein ACH48_11545 [Aeromonas caviae]
MALFHQQLAIVFPLSCQQIVQGHLGGVAGQVGILEHGGGGHMAIRLEYQVPGIRHLDRLQPLPHAFGEGGLAPHEHRHVGAQLHAELGQLVFTQAGLPEVVQGHEGGGRVRRAAPDATAHGQYLLQPDMGSLRTGQPALQQSRSPDDEVLFIGHAGNGRAQGELVAAGDRLEFEPVAVVEKDEEGLQFVVAIGAAAVDVQEEVELGRGGPADRRLVVHHGARVHSLICSLRRLSCPVMVSRWGRR